MKFRKKPVVIEAIRWIETNLQEVLKFCPCASYEKMASGQYMLVVETLESNKEANTRHCASVGDYIIKGIKGEFYPCKPDIFEATYESANSKSKDNIFINHIQSHLKSNQKVICKICGKTATEIIEKESNSS